MPAAGGHQGWAELAQNEEAGSIQLASSREPDFTKKRPGITSTSLKSCEPHSGQKLRTTDRPLSPCTSHRFGSPRIWKAPAGTMQKVAKALPVAR
jgi:hypothetical protein